ncbi:MAG: isochorismate synthase MenF [Actinomycetota bacterium]
MSRLVARTVELDPAVQPFDGAGDRDRIVWSSGARSLVAWGCAASVDAGTGDHRFERASSELQRIFNGLDVDDAVDGWATGPLAFGAFAFDPDSPSSPVMVPSFVLGRDGDRAWFTTIGDHSAPEPSPRPARSVDRGRAQVRRIGSSVRDGRWLGAVASARAAVADGIVDKVVLARDASVISDQSFSVHDIIVELAAMYPSCFTFSLDGLVGATPELLVRRRGRDVGSIVLGGSAPRGRSAAADERLAADLVASEKHRREHELAVVTVREALDACCEDVRVDLAPSLLPLPYVQHLRTDVRARLTRPLSALQLAGALHPTAAVCGVPTDKALATIRELEDLDRGRYCGPVGWVDARGDGEWGIALRCAEISGARARLWAGAGIVADSDPRAELAETELKLHPLLRALGA